jgi:LysM repeat protein
MRVSPVGFAGGADAILRVVDRVCPLLGLQGDRRSVIDGVDGGHRCHAEDPPTPLDRQQQARVCLTDAHERCDRYLAFVARHGGVHPGRAGLANGLRSTRMVLAPEPAWRGIAGQARRARAGPLALIGAGATVLGIGGVALATGMLDGPTDPGIALETGVAASIGPSATPTPTSRPTLTAAPIPSLSTPPTPVPTPIPTVPATPAPTAPPPPQQTYTVVQGDTLAAIAQRFGTTVARLQAANGIEDANEIFIGQVLVIA